MSVTLLSVSAARETPYTKIPSAVLQCQTLSDGAKVCLSVLKDIAKERPDHTISLSQEWLAFQQGTKRRATVASRVAELVEHGLVKVDSGWKARSWSTYTVITDHPLFTNAPRKYEEYRRTESVQAKERKAYKLKDAKRTSRGAESVLVISTEEPKQRINKENQKMADFASQSSAHPFTLFSGKSGEPEDLTDLKAFSEKKNFTALGTKVEATEEQGFADFDIDIELTEESRPAPTQLQFSMALGTPQALAPNMAPVSEVDMAFDSADAQKLLQVATSMASVCSDSDPTGAQPVSEPQLPAPNETQVRMLNLEAERAKAINKADNTKKLQEKRRNERAMENLGGDGTKSIKKQWRVPVAHVHQVWDTEFVAKYPEVPFAKDWKGKINGQAEMLVKKYGEVSTTLAIKYMVRFWDVLRLRFKNSGMYPTIGYLLALSDTLVPEAPKMFKAFEAKAAYEKWTTANADTTFAPPRELQVAYDAARSDLKSIGI